MKILLSHLSQAHPLFPFQPHQWRKLSSYNLSPRRIRLLRLPVHVPRCVAAPSSVESAAFNGWDDLRLRVETGRSGESNLVHSYLISLGFDDKKYVFVYILGFVCALAISRVRVSSIVAVPAAAIVFAIGFSFGFVNGGPRGVSLSRGKRKSKGDDLRIYDRKFRNLVKLFDDFDGRVDKLKDDISKAVQDRRVGVDDLERYVDAVELMGLCVKNARNVVEESVDCDSVEDHGVERHLNKKPNRRRKESGDNVFNWFELVFRFFQDNADGSKSSKKKESKHTSNLSQNDLLDSPDEEREINSKYAKEARRTNRRDLDNAYSYQSLDFNRKGRLDYEGKEIGVSQNGNFNFMEDMSREISQTRIDERFNDASGRELNFQSNRVRFTDDQQVTLRMSEYDEIGQWISHDGLDDNIDFGSQRRHVSLRHTKLHHNLNGASEYSHYRQKEEYENYSKAYRERTDMEGNPLANDDQSRERGFISSSSSILSDDVLFDKYLTEAHSLLKQAKECLRVRDNDMRVEQMLQDSAKLLSTALSLKPMSLLAMGLLGNAYLLHGELKFRFSQELRYLLSRSDNFNVDGWNNIPVSKDEPPPPTKDKLINLLIDACEECEKLLVEAGRKYRMALSIDGNDVRALYNWGLALSFRARLIADIGPEAASDADRLFLAAIDKFDAMMSRSKAYAPDALFRWGMILQQRSRLRPSNSRDKVRLLQQAKRLYEDAVEMGFDKLQAREALSSCVYELKPGR